MKSNTKMYHLQKNQIISFHGKNNRITCIEGILWITWPNGFGEVIKEGDEITVASKGKICIVAYGDSHFMIEKKARLKNYSYANNRSLHYKIHRPTV